MLPAHLKEARKGPSEAVFPKDPCECKGKWGQLFLPVQQLFLLNSFGETTPY